MLTVLIGVAGLAVAGQREATPTAVDRLAAVAASVESSRRPIATDAGALQGASALGQTRFVIPPPRWLLGRVRPTTERITSRERGLGWYTNPRAE